MQELLDNKDLLKTQKLSERKQRWELQDAGLLQQRQHLLWKAEDPKFAGPAMLKQISDLEKRKISSEPKASLLEWDLHESRAL